MTERASRLQLAWADENEPRERVWPPGCNPYSKREVEWHVHYRYGLGQLRNEGGRRSILLSCAETIEAQRRAGDGSLKAPSRTMPSDPLTLVNKACASRRRAERQYRSALAQARAAGFTLAEIGNAAGITRQAVGQLLAT